MTSQGTPDAAKIFISHSTEDAALADHFGTLLKDVSNNVLKPFRSTDLSGQEGITFGEPWFAALMQKLAEAQAVVCLLTERSIRSNWVLFEAGAAAATPNTDVHGILLGGLSTDEITHSPFGPIQVCDGTRDSLKGLVMQLVHDIGQEPNEKWIDKNVNDFVEDAEGHVSQSLRERALESSDRTDGTERWLPPALVDVRQHIQRRGDRPSIVEMFDINCLAPLHAGFEILTKLLTEGGSLRVVMLDPRCDVFKQRETFEHDSVGRIANELRASLHILADIRSHVPDSDIEIRLTDTLPPDGALLLVNADDSGGLAVCNPYPSLRGSRGLAASWMAFTPKQKSQFNHISEAFKTCWDGAKRIEIARQLGHPRSWPLTDVMAGK